MSPALTNLVWFYLFSQCLYMFWAFVRDLIAIQKHAALDALQDHNRRLSKEADSWHDAAVSLRARLDDLESSIGKKS